MFKAPQIDEELQQRYAAQILESNNLIEGLTGCKDIEPCLLKQDDQVLLNDMILRNNKLQLDQMRLTLTSGADTDHKILDKHPTKLKLTDNTYIPGNTSTLISIPNIDQLTEETITEEQKVAKQRFMN